MYSLHAEHLVKAVRLEREHEARHRRLVAEHRVPRRLFRLPKLKPRPTRTAPAVGVATAAAS